MDGTDYNPDTQIETAAMDYRRQFNHVLMDAGIPKNGHTPTAAQRAYRISPVNNTEMADKTPSIIVDPLTAAFRAKEGDFGVQ